MRITAADDAPVLTVRAKPIVIDRRKALGYAPNVSAAMATR
jgi:hypothetical protein